VINGSDREQVSPHLVISTLAILTTLDIYYPTFADKLVQSTQSYYAKEAETLINSMQPAEYIVHVDARLQQEATRCDRFFERQSKKEVLTVVNQELIANVSERIIVQGFNNLVKEHDVESLRTLYRLLSLVNQVDIIHTAWSDYIKV
jgi:transcriptional regulator of heat shock response